MYINLNKSKFIHLSMNTYAYKHARTHSDVYHLSQAAVEMLECASPKGGAPCEESPFSSFWLYVLGMCSLFSSAGSLLLLG